MQIKNIIRSLLLLFFAAPATAQTITAVENYARNRPGVVMVKTELSAVVNVTQLSMNQKAIYTLLDSINHLDTDSMRMTSEQKLSMMIHSFRSNASTYFSSTLTYLQYSRKIATIGSGFFVSSKGYVVTNCHVVDEADDYIRNKLISSIFRQVTASNIRAIEESWAVRFSETQRDELYDIFAEIYSGILPIQLYSKSKKITIVMAGDHGSEVSREIPASVVVKGKSMPGKDIAILKLQEKGNYPALSLATGKVSVGQRVLVYGYPENVLNNDLLSASTMSEPTLTSGIVSSLRKTKLNWSVIQMDAAINHGNSGGPVCNDRGEVIGIATFGSMESTTDELAAGYNFAIPLTEVKEFLKVAGINTDDHPKKWLSAEAYYLLLLGLVLLIVSIGIVRLNMSPRSGQ